MDWGSFGELTLSGQKNEDLRSLSLFLRTLSALLYFISTFRMRINTCFESRNLSFSTNM